jgi:O-antigen/teichoic acid export membrane protein
MSKILKNSAIYSSLNLLQKGINFLLIPVLTAYLTTHNYGVVAVVTVINSFLNVFYLCSLNASVNRFYYEFKGDDEKVKKLFGTVVTFVFSFSVFLSIILGFGHQFFLDPFLNDVEFYPYMILGMISILFNPVFAIFQYTLMVKQEASKYGLNSFLFFLSNLVFLLISVIILDYGAVGILGSLSLTNIIFFIYTLTRFGKDIVLGIDFSILKQSLKYSFPLIPHSIAGVTTSVIDRLIINNLLTTSMVGIYHIGNTFGGIIFIIASSVNQAFNPWFNKQVKEGKYDDIPEKAKLLIIFYCIIALGVSFFCKEVLQGVTPVSYHEAWEVVPFISFAFVLHGSYYFFAVPLFYDISGKGNRVLPIVTIFSAILNASLNFIMIPKYGIIGAAVATLISKLVLVISLSFIYNKFLAIKYHSKEMILIPLIYFVISLITFMSFEMDNELLLKICIYLLVLFLTFLFYKKEIIAIKKA